MFWLLPRLMIITETESYFLNSNPAGHCLDWQPLFRPSIKRFFLRPLLTAVYLAYIPISLLLRNKRLMCLFPVKTRRLFGADVQLRKYCITNRIRRCLDFLKVTSLRDCFLGGMKILTPGRSQKSDHPSAICFFWIQFTAKGLYLCLALEKPCTRIFLAER